MITRIILATAVAVFFTPASLVLAQEHPEHPKKEGTKTGERPKKGGEKKQSRDWAQKILPGGKVSACIVA